MFPDSPLGGKQSPPGGVNPGNPLSALEMTRLALFKMYNQAGLPPPPLRDMPGMPPSGLDVGRAMAEQQARALQAVRDAERERVVANANNALNSGKDERGSPAPPQVPAGLANAASAVSAAVNELSRQQKEKERELQNERMVRLRGEEDDDDIVDDVDNCSPPPMKRERHDSGEGRSNGSPALGGANIRISSRGNKRNYLVK